MQENEKTDGWRKKLASDAQRKNRKEKRGEKKVHKTEK
jgi:hypothetical protein